MTQFIIKKKYYITLYVEAESEQEALKTWSHTPRIILEDENGIEMHNPETTLPLENLHDWMSEEFVGETTIEKVED